MRFFNNTEISLMHHRWHCHLFISPVLYSWFADLSLIVLSFWHHKIVTWIGGSCKVDCEEILSIKQKIICSLMGILFYTNRNLLRNLELSSIRLNPWRVIKIWCAVLLMLRSSYTRWKQRMSRDFGIFIPKHLADSGVWTVTSAPLPTGRSANFHL